MKSILTRLMPARETAPVSLPTLPSVSDRDGAHREIAALALRDVLRKFGVPPTWITANPQVSTTARRGRGIHLHLTVREWQPHLLIFLVNIERQVRARTLRLDPFASEWLTGVSWKFELVDESECPALPGPDYWSAYAQKPAPSCRPVPVLSAVYPGAPAGGPSESVRPTADAGATQELAFLPTQPMSP